MCYRPSHIRFLAALLGIMVAGSSPALAAPASRASRATRASIKRSLSVRSSRYGVPTFTDSEKGDVAAYDDPTVRKAAIDALGRYNGSVVAIDPASGRILTVVNQNLAFSAGFIPCSTIKPC